MYFILANLRSYYVCGLLRRFMFGTSTTLCSTPFGFWSGLYYVHIMSVLFSVRVKLRPYYIRVVFHPCCFTSIFRPFCFRSVLDYVRVMLRPCYFTSVFFSVHYTFMLYYVPIILRSFNIRVFSCPYYVCVFLRPCCFMPKVVCVISHSCYVRLILWPCYITSVFYYVSVILCPYNVRVILSPSHITSVFLRPYYIRGVYVRVILRL